MPIVDTSLRSESSPSSTARAVSFNGPRANRSILLLLAAMAAYSASQASLVRAATGADGANTTIDAAVATSSVDDTVLITVTAQDGSGPVGAGDDEIVLTTDVGTFTAPGVTDGEGGMNPRRQRRRYVQCR